MAKHLQFLRQNVDQMVAMFPSNVINLLISAGVLTKMAMNLLEHEQTEDVPAQLKVCIYEIYIDIKGYDSFDLNNSFDLIVHL